MNRRSFFARFLGAACLAVAERVLPSSLSKVEPQWSEPEAEALDWTRIDMDTLRIRWCVLDQRVLQIPDPCGMHEFYAEVARALTDARC